MTSTKAEDVRPDWEDLPEKEQQTLNDWMTFFSKRYNIVGVVTKTDQAEPKTLVEPETKSVLS